MLSSSWNNLDFTNGAGRIRPVQLGFPAELTSTWDEETGYSWKRLYLSGVTVTNPDLQATGNRAVTPDNNTDLESGARGWLEPDAGAAGYVFHAVYEPPDGSASASACSWLAGIETTDCLLLTVVSATGRCSGVDTTQEITLEWDGVDSWDGTTTFTHTGAGSPGAAVFTFTAPDPPALTIDGVEGLYQGCSDGKLYFAFGGTTLCGGSAGDCNNSFVVAITCTCCDLEGYAGPGWYVVAGEGESDCFGELTVVELTGCDGDVIICDGPFETEEDAQNAIDGTPPPAPFPFSSCETVDDALDLGVLYGDTLPTTLQNVKWYRWAVAPATNYKLTVVVDETVPPISNYAGKFNDCTLVGDVSITTSGCTTVTSTGGFIYLALTKFDPAPAITFKLELGSC
jgi:hypothetical protein